RFINGIDHQLHPEAKPVLNFITSFLQHYGSYPSYEHLRERFNLHYQYHATPHLGIGELADRIRLEKAKADCQRAIVEVQKYLTTEDVSIGELLKPLIKLQNDLFNSQESEIVRLSEYR